MDNHQRRGKWPLYPRSDWEIKTAAQTIRRTNADILVVMLGSNDLLQCPGLPAEVYGERMEKFLAAILAEAQQPLKALLVAPPPMEPGSWVSDSKTLEQSRRLAGCYQAVARRAGVAFADAGAWDIGLCYDGVHFSEAGHRVFAEGMRIALKHTRPEQIAVRCAD